MKKSSIIHLFYYYFSIIQILFSWFLIYHMDKGNHKILFLFKKNRSSSTNKNNTNKINKFQFKPITSKQIKQFSNNKPLQIIKESPRNPHSYNKKNYVKNKPSSLIDKIKHDFNEKQCKERIQSGNLMLSTVKEIIEEDKERKKCQNNTKITKIIYRNKIRQIHSGNNYHYNYSFLFSPPNNTFLNHNSTSDIFKKKIQVPFKIKKRDLSNDALHKKQYNKGMKLIKFTKLSEGNKSVQTVKKKLSSTSKDDRIISLYKRKRENLITNKILYKEIKGHNILGDQGLLVPDENVSIISPKSIPYTKQIYTNNYLSDLFQSFLQQSYNISSHFLSFLGCQDLFNLSLVNKNFYFLTLEKIREVIINKILNNKGNIRKKIWEKLKNFSKLPQVDNINKEYIENVFHNSKYFDIIKKDICRAVPSPNKKEEGQLKVLFSLLNAYANFNIEIGYAQGMNFITEKLLFKYSSEIDTFIILDSLINKLKLESVLGVKNTLEKHMTIISHLIEEYIPSIYRYFIQTKLTHEIMTANWIITLFSNSCNNDLLFIIWDFILVYEWKFIYLFIISIIKYHKKKILVLNNTNFSIFSKDILRSPFFYENFKKIISLTFDLMNKKEWTLIKSNSEPTTTEDEELDDIVNIESDDNSFSTEN